MQGGASPSEDLRGLGKGKREITARKQWLSLRKDACSHVGHRALPGAIPAARGAVHLTHYVGVALTAV